MNKNKTHPRVLSAGSITGDNVRNPRGEDLGTLHEIMIDVQHGKIAYAVLSFGGFLGLGDKLFAIPWDMLQVGNDHEFVLDVSKEQLEKAEGFDKSDWPDFADESFHTQTYGYWRRPTYWTT